MAMPQSMTIEEQILYWLSLDLRVRALAERLLDRFAVTVGDLPASAAHHHAEPRGLYRHSLEVALKALEEFGGETVRVFGRPEELAERLEASGYDIPANEIEAGMELLVKVGQTNNGYKIIEEFLPDAAQ
jgi:hypothetical protein